jgi:hypothetical protein
MGSSRSSAWRLPNGDFVDERVPFEGDNDVRRLHGTLGGVVSPCDGELAPSRPDVELFRFRCQRRACGHVLFRASDPLADHGRPTRRAVPPRLANGHAGLAEDLGTEFFKADKQWNPIQPAEQDRALARGVTRFLPGVRRTWPPALPLSAPLARYPRHERSGRPRHRGGY